MDAPPSAEEVALVVRLLGDPSPLVRNQAGDVLSATWAPEAGAVFAEAIAQARPAVRPAVALARISATRSSWPRSAHHLLRARGARSAEVLAALEAAARDPSPEVVEHARLVLEALDPCTSSGIRSAR